MPFDIRPQKKYTLSEILNKSPQTTTLRAAPVNKKQASSRSLVLKTILAFIIGIAIAVFLFFLYLTSLLDNQLVYRNSPTPPTGSVRLAIPPSSQNFMANVAELLLRDDVVLRPRDLFVISGNETFARKINSLYQLGLIRAPDNPTKQLIGALEDLTGQSIHYTVLVDLQLVKEAVDALGGLTVDVSTRIYDPAFPGLNYSYQVFSLEPGVQELDGDTVVKYVRSRHSLLGDFDRTERQRQVTEALAAKIRDVHISQFPDYWNLLSAFRERVATNMSIAEMKRLYRLTKDIRSNDILTAALDNQPGAGLLASTHIETGGPVPAYALIPKNGYNEFDDIHAFFEHIFETF
ncbi:MAG: Cell envelope-related function transcriptional attenuator common domain protein [Parcubacteria group bacterium GW2011_GWA2_47_8]|nr:MAG: Cell envelope-related function transcriptional attenuator common domain protein [Parcubacteria group bacterium GW2011_GWA2_47_8]